MPTDHLFQEFIAGDGESFRRLHERYAPRLRYFARRYMGDSPAVEDILQDAFVSLWEKRASVRDEPSMRGFLYTGVRNRCLNALRREKIRTAHAPAPDAGSHEDFLEKVIETEFFDMLFALVGELPPAGQQVYRYSLEGKRNEEIAGILGISVNTVKKYKVNANHYLRGRVKEMTLLLAAL